MDIEAKCRGEGSNELCNGCKRLDGAVNIKPFSIYILYPDDGYCNGYIGDYIPNPSSPWS